MTFHNWLELAFVAWGFIATVLVIFERIWRDRSPGARAIQYVVAVNILPLIGFLALESKLSNEGVGTILGVVVGYTLPGVLKRGPWGAPNKEKADSSAQKAN